MITDETELIIPDYDPNNPKSYPGDTKPGYYSQSKVKKLQKKHKDSYRLARAFYGFKINLTAYHFRQVVLRGGKI
jgi:hypothetical protein